MIELSVPRSQHPSPNQIAGSKGMGQVARVKRGCLARVVCFLFDFRPSSSALCTLRSSCRSWPPHESLDNRPADRWYPSATRRRIAVVEHALVLPRESVRDRHRDIHRRRPLRGRDDRLSGRSGCRAGRRGFELFESIANLAELGDWRGDERGIEQARVRRSQRRRATRRVSELGIRLEDRLATQAGPGQEGVVFRACPSESASGLRSAS